jgi:hypothetical protein
MKALQSSFEMGETTDDGDFFQSCLPNTYRYFCLLQKHRLNEDITIDAFDRYIKEHVPFLGSMMDQYYSTMKNPGLQLCKLCEEKSLLNDHDCAMLSFIKNPKNNEAFARILQDYISILESTVVRLIKKIDESRHD